MKRIEFEDCSPKIQEMMQDVKNALVKLMKQDYDIFFVENDTWNDNHVYDYIDISNYHDNMKYYHKLDFSYICDDLRKDKYHGKTFCLISYGVIVTKWTLLEN